MFSYYEISPFSQYYTSHNPLHFPNVIEQFSSMSLPILEMFSSSRIFTTSSLIPLPGFWASSYDSSNPSKYYFFNIPTNPQTCTFHSAFDFHSHYSPCQKSTYLSCQLKNAFKSQLKSHFSKRFLSSPYTPDGPPTALQLAFSCSELFLISSILCAFSLRTYGPRPNPYRMF